MKKLLYIFMIAAVLVSCKKNTTETPAPVNQQTQEVTFDINTILESPNRAYSVPNCNDSIDGEINKYAQIILQDAGGVIDTFYAEIYYVEGLPYTKAIMLPIYDMTDSCDTYVLKGFLVYDNMGTAGYDDTARADDILFKAAPLPGSEFWDFAVNRVEWQFEVCAFFKTKILIDVLCFVPNDYELFGFFWFEITEITVREMCFFGDFCLKDTYIYEGTAYDTSGGGVFIDEAAIFQIVARHQKPGGTLLPMVGSPFDNMDWLGVGEPLCIRYPDYDVGIDYYEFDLYLWAMVGNTMDWVYLYTFTWNDIFEDKYDPGMDGVYEFVVGNCVASPTDMLFPPYMNLPGSGQMFLYSPADPGALTGAYWDVEFSGFGAGYDIMTGVVYPGWCGDKWHTIDFGSHDVWFYSTLDDAGDFPTSSELTNRKLEQLNYLFNHYDSHGLDLYPLGLFPSETTEAIQESVWMVIHDGTSQPFTPTNALAATMGTEALGSSSVNYKIPPGGDAGVLMFTEQGAVRVEVIEQLVLVVVDP